MIRMIKLNYSDHKHCYIYLSYNIYTSSKLMTFWVKQTTQWENKRNHSFGSKSLNYHWNISKIAFGTTWVWRGLRSMNKGPNATICLVRRQNHAGTTVSWTTVQLEKSSHAYKLTSNVQTACSTDSLNNCPKHSILRFSSFALKIYLWLKMCQPNLPCSIVYAHCLLPWRAFASLYVLLFLGKEAEIGGRVLQTVKSKTQMKCSIMHVNGDLGSGVTDDEYFNGDCGPNSLRILQRPVIMKVVIWEPSGPRMWLTLRQVEGKTEVMRFPTIWHFDKCRLRRACAASF